MLPNYVVEETAVREPGESSVFELGEDVDQNLLITLGITHAIEQESIDVEIFSSSDNRVWSMQPVVSFPRKFFCGTYQMILPHSSGKFLKAVWRVSRWGRAESRPFFRFYIFAQRARARALAGAA